jgi:hypothetical protein
VGREGEGLRTEGQSPLVAQAARAKRV